MEYYPVILKVDEEMVILNDGEDYKKPREGSLNDSFALNSTALEDVFTGSLQSPECGKI